MEKILFHGLSMDCRELPKLLLHKIVDTTGAGDAFLAGFISKLISSGYPSNELEMKIVLSCKCLWFINLSW